MATKRNLNFALSMLEKTSRTFFIPIIRLDPALREAVASAYLCMRVIDEIEDHPGLSISVKSVLLNEAGFAVRDPSDADRLAALFGRCPVPLPDVTVKLSVWLDLCPSSARPIVSRHVAKMAGLMSEWTEKQWNIRTKSDLDGYTYSVAGLVGEMLAELWLWFDGTVSDAREAVAFGRGLQAVNILRNRTEDLRRGVDFFPDGWRTEDMIEYAKQHLRVADKYVAELRAGPAREFCKLPLALAHATIRTIESGGSKLSRTEVLDIVNHL